jgi:hypothetical protein
MPQAFPALPVSARRAIGPGGDHHLYALDLRGAGQSEGPPRRLRHHYPRCRRARCPRRARPAGRDPGRARLGRLARVPPGAGRPATVHGVRRGERSAPMAAAPQAAAADVAVLVHRRPRSAAFHNRNESKLRSQAAWAHLCGVAPIAASSGKVTRWRLNRGGDREATMLARLERASKASQRNTASTTRQANHIGTSTDSA